MLADQEVRILEERIRALETRTGVQVVISVIDRADRYHGLRWRALALGVSLASLGVMVWDRLRERPTSPDDVLFVVAVILAVGLAAALAATLLPPFSRLFLEPGRALAEVRTQAESQFLSRELFRTRTRSAVLLLASRFEREAVVYVDVGLRERLAREQLNEITAPMRPHLRSGRIAQALLVGLAALEALLVSAGCSCGGAGVNELPDRPVCGGSA